MMNAFSDSMYGFKVLFLVIIEILKMVGPALLVVFIMLALACYGFQMLRLFFKI